MIDPENAGLLSGLFGDFDGNPDNDFRMPNGTQAEDEIEFGESWLVPGSCKKGRNASGLNPVITAKARAEAEIVCAGETELVGFACRQFHSCLVGCATALLTRNCNMMDLGKLGMIAEIQQEYSPQKNEMSDRWTNTLYMSNLRARRKCRK